VIAQPEHNVENSDVDSAMEQRRSRLDELDTLLIRVIGQRMQVCTEIAWLKRKGRIPMLQPHRLEHVRAKSVEEGQARGLNDVFVHRLLDVIFQESCRLEDLIINN
jgi:4-amino-4-deoxychorismate mutase